MRNFGDNLFAGTAQYYARFRPPYPPELLNDIVRIFKLNGHGRLFDLGCGTGELSLPLARHFEQVLAVDPDRGMLKLGQAKAKEHIAQNISWQKSSSRNLTGVSGLFKLITMGQSFHWMEQKEVLEQLYELIEPGGGLLIVGTVPALQNKATTQKEDIIKRLVSEFLGPERRAGDSVYVPPPKKYDDLFNDSKFRHCQKRIYKTKVVRSVEQELGNLYSMSWARRQYFGRKIARFEREFRDQISKVSADDGFENIVRYEAYFLRK